MRSLRSPALLASLSSSRPFDSTVGDVVHLVRTLPRLWLESYIVTAARAQFLAFLRLFSSTSIKFGFP